MFGIQVIEWVGYTASITVKAYPVGIINTFIFFVNSYYLYKFYKEK